MVLRFAKKSMDLVITLLLWVYFTAGLVILFSPFYLAVYPFARCRAAGYQVINHFFYRGLFLLIRVLMPWQTIVISPEVYTLRSSVIVSNHVSYLDPILLISIFKKNKTIVKGQLFNLPIFGFIVRTAGYLPSVATARSGEIMGRQLRGMADFFKAGGNLFIFPEGTRSRDGGLGKLNRGAFKVARKQQVPVHVLKISNADKLFPPGKFLFDTCNRNTITVDLLGSITPDYAGATVTTDDLMVKARQMMAEND